MSENPLITALRDSRDAKQSELDQLLEAPAAEKRNLTDEESAKFNEIREELKGFDERITELVELDKRKAEADEARKTIGNPSVNEPNPVYRRDGHWSEPQFFKDMLAHKTNDATLAGQNMGGLDEVRRRLAAAQERRTGDLSTAAGAGGEFAPPLWLVEDYVKLARAGRVSADRLQQEVLPRGVSSINLPAVATGTTAGVQQTQNTAVSDTAMSTTSVTSGITTIAGKQTVSRQMIDQSGIPFDRVILGDLAADYAKKLDVQVVSGTNASGELNGLVTAAGNAISWTATQPVQVSSTTAASFYYQLISAVNKVQVNRFDSPTAILMHPRRFNWLLAYVGSNGQPIVTPTGPVFNVLATADGGAPAQGMVGNMLGLPVFTDANLTTGTNQDMVFVLRASDSWLFESPLESASFDATYADQATVLFRVLGYAALVHRYSKSISKITGVGLVDPGL
jgi:HK97 family phage major capsid protein